jgi:hypothetical protein
MNTSLAGSNRPCSRIQRRRARATSARSCSAARKLFFERDLVPMEEPPDRRATARNFALTHHPDDLVQRSASKKSACFSSGDVLPPRGLAAQRPVSRKHFTQITAVLGLTS